MPLSLDLNLLVALDLCTCDFAMVPECVIQGQPAGPADLFVSAPAFKAKARKELES